MTDDFGALIREGFHKENLKRLSRLAEGLVASNPSLYGTLFLLLRQLEGALDEQADPTHRIETIRLALEGPILDLLAAEKQPPSELIARLDEVLRNGLAVLT